MRDNSTRERILAATRELVEAGGSAAAVTVGQVAAAAHVSRATLYRYFPHKVALLHAADGANGRSEAAQTPRARIIAATIDIVSERGLNAATLDDIAERAGLSRSGLQWHYRNKDELITDVARSIPALLSIARAVAQPVAGDVDCGTQLWHATEAMLQEAALIRRVVPFLLLEVTQHADVAHLISTHTFGPLLRRLTELFEQHTRVGELRPGSAQVRAQALIGMYLTLLLVKPAFPQIMTTDDEATAHEYIDILLNGILAHPQKDSA